MSCFLTHKQCAKEVEVEEVHAKENLETPTMKHNNVRVQYSSSMTNGKMGTRGCQQRMGRCSALTAKSLIKQAETNSFQAESMRIENVHSYEARNAHKTSHSKRPAEQPIVKALTTIEKHNINLMKKLFTTAFFVAKNEKLYTDIAELTELQAANYGDGILTKHYNNDKQRMNLFMTSPNMKVA